MSQLRCPECLEKGSEVKQTRDRLIGLKRTHLCGKCGARFESLELPLPVLERVAGAFRADGETLEQMISEAWDDAHSGSGGEAVTS